METRNIVERCNKLISHARSVGVDAVLVISPINRRYFSGFTGSNGYALITERKRILFTDFRYTIQAKQQTGGNFEICEIKGSNLIETIAARLEREHCIMCGYEDEFVTIAQFATLKKLMCRLEPMSAAMAKIRMVKSQDEIDNIIHAQNIADKSFAELINILSPGMTEKEAANELDYLMRKFGAEENSFDTIVGSGPNSALCHAIPTDRKLTNGDMVVFDFGCKYNGYCSDMTRTVAIGKVAPELLKIYKIVREAQALALRAVTPGVSGKKVDAIARECIKAHGYGDYFGHSTGHGFGLEVHESPSASERSTNVLTAGMTITVEPGIYVEGLGGVRIEDCVILSDKGHINPVTTTKDLIIIE